MAASALLVGWTQESEPVTFRSPQELAWAPDGSLLAVSDRTAGCLVLIDPATKKVLREVSLKGSPEDVAWASDGRMVYVAEYDAGTVAEIDPAAGKVLRRLAVGPKPRGLALCEGRLLVTEAGLHDLRVLDLKSGETRSRIPVVRRPTAIAIGVTASRIVASGGRSSR